MLETGFNKSLAVPMIRGESGFQVPKATPQSGIEQTKNDLSGLFGTNDLN